ncbi:hypothetical protein G7K71_07220 [Desulfofundulus sp. TPOSR]|uniref:hypothetical protein n=1 Tax=Desulfofundulus sp. TPOSR TaxID=2714340 RepID=UPI00140D1661|nr:hypothetical protein [Desulfofundulus sp. TPOSR]NHM26774.1 hypothetical protein [Desulfofundulus sp. TPOSR]
MTFARNQHYLARRRTGELWHIFVENGMLGYRVVSPACHGLTVARSLVEDPVLDFDVGLDPGDYIHLVCLTREGQLKYYITKPEGGWNIAALARFDLKSQVFRCLTLKLFPGRVHIFWATASVTNYFLWAIQHSCWLGNEWQDEQVAEIIAGKNLPPFYPALDSQGNLHLVYTSAPGGKNYEAFYRKFNASFGLWSHTEKIDLPVESIQGIYCLVDNRDNLHLICTGFGDRDRSRVIYRQRREVIRGTARWEKQQMLYQGRQNCLQPFLFIRDRYLQSSWREGNGYAGCRSNDLGKTWEQAQPFTLRQGKSALFTYLTGVPSGGSFQAGTICGVITAQGISIPFNELLEVIEPPGKVSDMDRAFGGFLNTAPFSDSATQPVTQSTTAQAGGTAPETGYGEDRSCTGEEPVTEMVLRVEALGKELNNLMEEWKMEKRTLKESLTELEKNHKELREVLASLQEKIDQLCKGEEKGKLLLGQMEKKLGDFKQREEASLSHLGEKLAELSQRQADMESLISYLREEMGNFRQQQDELVSSWACMSESHNNLEKGLGNLYSRVDGLAGSMQQVEETLKKQEQKEWIPLLEKLSGDVMRLDRDLRAVREENEQLVLAQREFQEFWQQAQINNKRSQVAWETQWQELRDHVEKEIKRLTGDLERYREEQERQVTAGAQALLRQEESLKGILESLRIIREETGNSLDSLAARLDELDKGVAELAGQQQQLQAEQERWRKAGFFQRLFGS